MKPIILVEVDGYFKLNKEQLDEMLKDAYEEGKKDGGDSNCDHCYWYLRPYRWGYSPWWQWPHVTYTTGTSTTTTGTSTGDYSTTTDAKKIMVKPTYTTDTTSTDPGLWRKENE